MPNNSYLPKSKEGLYLCPLCGAFCVQEEVDGMCHCCNAACVAHDWGFYPQMLNGVIKTKEEQHNKSLSVMHRLVFDLESVGFGKTSSLSLPASFDIAKARLNEIGFDNGQ